MARDTNEMEENAEQRDEGQAQEIADEAVNREMRGIGDQDRDPTIDSEHGGSPNPADIIPDDVPDLIDTMNQMLTSGRIDNGAFAGEPMMDDEEDQFGQTETDDDDGLRIEEV